MIPICVMNQVPPGRTRTILVKVHSGRVVLHSSYTAIERQELSEYISYYSTTGRPAFVIRKGIKHASSKNIQ